MGLFDKLKKTVGDALGSLDKAKPADSSSKPKYEAVLSIDDLTSDHKAERSGDTEALYNMALDLLNMKEIKGGEIVIDPNKKKEIAKIIENPDAPVDNSKALELALKAYEGGLVKAANIIAIIQKAANRPNEAVAILAEGAQRGDTMCMRQLASYYMTASCGLPQNMAKGKEYLQMAVDAGDYFAYSTYSDLCFVYGDIETSIEYLNEAAQLGSPAAYYSLALRYVEGTVFNRDLDKAKYFAEKAITEGKIEAYGILGIMAKNHQGNSRKAMEYFKKGAELMDATSAYFYASCLIEARDENAIKFFKIAYAAGISRTVLFGQPGLPILKYSVKANSGAPDGRGGFSKPVNLEVKSQQKSPDYNEIWEEYVVKYGKIPPLSFKEGNKEIKRL